MRLRTLILCLATLFSVASARAATLYVNAAGTNPVPPYADWPTAAAAIQDAVDAALAGDEIVVTDGVYQTGARAVYGMSNRVAVTKAVTVRSVNGPTNTIIQGAGPLGDSAVRCVYLTSGATLSGFTLNDGATQDVGDDIKNRSGGGVWCEEPSAVVSNCTLTGNSAYMHGGGAYGGTLNHCTLTGNWATYNGGGASSATLNDCVLSGNAAVESGGGGAATSTLDNCTLTNNSAFFGGGAINSTLTNCTIAGNSAGELGGGARNSTFFNCTLTGNHAGDYGGGAYGGSLNNCTLTGNSAYVGGGAINSTLVNCALTGNLAWNFGGGASQSTLTNCTIAENSAEVGGGVSYCAIYNCIVYYNSNFDFDDYNYYGCAFTNSCTTPDPGSGVGNITNAPLFVDTNGWSNLRLQSNSPCINAGNNAYVAGNTDLDGHPRIVGGVVDIGAFEWQGTTRYVSAASTNPIAPYSSWDYAAVTIQDAVDAAAPGDEIVVTNGLYATGGRPTSGMSLTNRVCVDRAITLRSVNGPEVTTIVGSGLIGPAAVRCVYLTNGTVLAGFTLTNGRTLDSIGLLGDDCGAAVWCASQSALVTNCVLSGNSASDCGGGALRGTLNNCALIGNSVLFGGGGGAYRATLSNCTVAGNSGNDGGGAYFSVLNNCILSDNLGTWGGGAEDSTLNNCILTRNSAEFGGGANSATLNNCTLIGNSSTGGGGGVVWCGLNNCIVYYNSTLGIDDNYYASTMNYSCTTPDTGSGVGNITNAPLFVDTNGWSNLRLQSNSPCINAGNNAYVTTSTDLDGRPRVVGATVDIGAYEYQGSGVGEFTGWLQLHGLPTDGSADFTDPDADGANNFQEYRGGTDPTSGLSVLRLRSPAPSGSDVAVTWQSMAGVSYALEWSTNLGAVPAFQPLATNLPGQAGLTTFTHTNGAAASPRFYRVRVP